jgi:hypothetical protein
VADSAGLLNRCRGLYPYRGFESRPLRFTSRARRSGQARSIFPLSVFRDSCVIVRRKLARQQAIADPAAEHAVQKKKWAGVPGEDDFAAALDDQLDDAVDAFFHGPDQEGRCGGSGHGLPSAPSTLSRSGVSRNAGEITPTWTPSRASSTCSAS